MPDLNNTRVAALLAATEATSTYELEPDEIQAKVLDTADEFHAWLVQDQPGQVYRRKPLRGEPSGG